VDFDPISDRLWGGVHFSCCSHLLAQTTLKFKKIKTRKKGADVEMITAQPRVKVEHPEIFIFFYFLFQTPRIAQPGPKFFFPRTK